MDHSLENERIRLKRFSIRQLHDRFDHEITFDESEKIAIITAPNGFGKTAFMKLIDAALNLKFTLLTSISYQVIEAEFSDQHTLRIAKPSVDAREHNPRLKIELSNDGKRVAKVESTDDDRPRSKSYRAQRIAMMNSNLVRVGPEMWRDRTTGEVYDITDIDPFFHDPRHWEKHKRQFEQIENYLSGISCTLINAQRTVSFDAGRRNSNREDAHIKHGVDDRAETLKNEFQKYVTEYAALSQRLDSTFPKRILTRIATDDPPPIEEELREKLERLNERRSQFTRVSLINDSDSHIQAPKRTFEKQLRHVLQIYADDINQKLDVLEPFRLKIDTFLTKLNSKFVFKRVSLTNTGDVEVVSDEERLLKLTDLSSGEQHEFILLFDLIFKSDSSSLFLIDEPEISLHVAWQKVFIKDLQDISNLTGFQSVIATHSPQVIGDYWGMVTEFGE